MKMLRGKNKKYDLNKKYILFMLSLLIYFRYHFDSVATDNDAEDFNVIHQITQLTSQEVPNLP
jgi:hypothetical protein